MAAFGGFHRNYTGLFPKIQSSPALVFFPSSCAYARVDLLPPVSCKFSVICDKVIGKYLNKETCLS